MAGRIVYGMWRVDKKRNSPEKQVEILKELLKNGINTIDTADIYGENAYDDAHRVLAAAFELAPELKGKFQIITKCGVVAREKSEMPYYNNDKEYIIAQVQSSLKALNMQQVDTLLIHRPDIFSDFDQIYLAFKELQERKLVKHFGVSNFTPIQFQSLQKYLAKRNIELITNQIEINPYTFEHFDNDNIFYLKGLEVRPMIWSPFAGGKLFEDNEISRVIEKIAQKYQCQRSDIVIAYLNNQGLNPDIIVGTQQIERIIAAQKALAIKLSKQDMYVILKALTNEDVK